MDGHNNGPRRDERISSQTPSNHHGKSYSKLIPRPFPGKSSGKKPAQLLPILGQNESDASAKRFVSSGPEVDLSEVDNILARQAKIPDEDFLRIDQSRLPMELFDEAAESTEGCEELVRLCNTGKSLLYADGAWSWHKCKVVKYCEESLRFSIEFVESGREKQVRRLSLVFDSEDFNEFSKRVVRCRKRREEAKSLARLDYFIRRQATERFARISDERWKRMCILATQGVKAFHSFNDPESNEFQIFHNTLAAGVDEVEFLYYYILKKAVILHLVKHSPKLRARFRKLKLPLEILQKKAVEIPTNERSRIVQALQPKVADSLDIALHHVLLWFRSNNLRLLPSTFHTMDSLEAFKLYNLRFCKAATDEIRHHLQCLVVNSLNLNIENRYRGRPSIVEKRLRLFAVQLGQFLRHTLAISLVEWMDGLLQGQKPILTIRVRLKERTTSGVRTSPLEEEVLTVLEAIIEATMVSLKKAVTIECRFLGIDDTIEGCPLEQFFDAAAIMQKLMPLAARTSARLPELTERIREHSSSYSSITEKLPKATIEDDMQRLFSFLDDCNRSTDDTDLDPLTSEEQEVIVKVGKRGLESEVTSLVKLRDNLQAQVCSSTVNTGMFALDATSLRNGIADKLSRRLNCIVERVFELQSESATEVNEQWEAMYQELCARPCDEQELRDQREYLSVFESQYRTLVSESMLNHEWMSLLVSAQYQMPYESFEKVWTLKLWPNRIKSAAARCKKQVEAERRRMVDALQVEKMELQQLLEDYADEVEDLKGQGDVSEMEKMLCSVTSLNHFLKDALRKTERMARRDAALGESKGSFPLLHEIIDKFKPYNTLWTSISNFHRWREQWMSNEICQLNFEEIEERVSSCATEAFRLRKALSKIDENGAKLASSLRDDCEAFKLYLPLVRALATPAMKRRHWIKLCEEVLEATVDKQCSLELLVELGVIEHLDMIEAISLRAEKEYSVERNIRVMQEEWRGVSMDVVKYKETEGFVLTKDSCEQIFDLLDEHLVKTQTALSSPFVKPILSIAQGWQRKLSYAHALIEELLACQRRWTYLEPIFRSDDIKKQMPTEAMRFAGIHTQWCKVMGRVADSPAVMELIRDEKLIKVFEESTRKLDRIFKGLTDYLDMKRFQFPRFFFLSNDELLEILAETKDAHAVQPFLCKCFEGIDRVNFSNSLIDTLISGEGESVELVDAVDTESEVHLGNTELWLKALETSMQKTVLHRVVAASDTYPGINPSEKSPVANEDRNAWVLSHPGQAVLSASQLKWTQEVENAFSGGERGIAQYLRVLDEQLKAIALLVRGDSLSRLNRMTLASLCVIDVHQRDVVDDLCKAGVRSARAFEWTAQLRYYWETTQDRGKTTAYLNVRLLNAEQTYANEYLGNSSRLVITPLTDRCYRTLMVAVSLLYGGAPTGPAGTGKTETTKDLAKVVARQCIVFNCSEGLESFAMSKFFKGLVETGAWACFDEFNRIELDVLSVVAMQILTIVNAKRMHAKRFDFEGCTLTLNAQTNCFVTMNPGYAGRQELPDNLQALFRSCAMMVPDYALIAEIKLFSYGFLHAREMATKLTQVLILCSQQLSVQKHYDYGMRAVFAILIRAGRLRELHQDSWTEDTIVCTAVRDVNLPKFTQRDLCLFNAIVLDLFPTTKLVDGEGAGLADKLTAVCERRHLQMSDEVLEATCRLHKTVEIRHGVMVVGGCGSGKSSLVGVLAEAMEGVTLQSVNPKSVTLAQLYGTFDEATREWQDGLLSSLFRACAQDTSGQQRWIRLDGPVDAGWIEDMNTVLDDNKRLCLQNGEIIRMTNQMTMLFEADNLEAASPATVSRVGMIYLEQQRITPQMLVTSFFASNPTTYAQLPLLMDTMLSPCLSFFESDESLPIPVAPNEIVLSVCHLFQSLVSKMAEQTTQENVENALVFAAICGVGSKLTAAAHDKFIQYLDRHFEDAASRPESDRRSGLRVQEVLKAVRVGTFFDPTSCEWHSWDTAVRKDVLESWKLHNFNEILVPTVETVRQTFLLQTLVENGKSVLCVGVTGSGKSAWISSVLKRDVPSTFKPLCISLTAQTSGNSLQYMISNKLQKRRRGLCGPPLGTKLVVTIDDLNLPAKDFYGSQPPLEFVRQWMDYNGWYQHSDWGFFETVDMQFVAAMGYPGGGRNTISARLTRHLFLVHFLELSSSSASSVFARVTSYFFEKFAASVQDELKQVVQSTTRVYECVRKELLPTPAKPHYTFNFRDVSRVTQGVCATSPLQTQTPAALQSLWCHEVMRVFHDRLSDDEDRSWLCALLRSIHPNVEAERLVFASFKDNDCLMEAREYEQIERQDMGQLVVAAEAFLEEHNSLCKVKLDLILFDYAVLHLTRIVRVLSLPATSLLLLGFSGSGRRTLTRLAVVITEKELFQLELTRSYGANEWAVDLKKLFRRAGVENRSLAFLLSDRDILLESFLEDVNCLLGAGRVPDLFSAEEAVQLCDDMGEDSEIQEDVDKRMEEFYRRCVSNIHIVLVISPVGKRFVTRLRQFPNIVNCCTIDWFSPWPEEALLTVARRILKPMKNPEPSSSNAGVEIEWAGVAGVAVNLHAIAQAMCESYRGTVQRYCYVTPRTLVDLLRSLFRLHQSATGRITELKSKYTTGLKKIEDAASQVSQMQVELESLKPQLVESKAQAEAKLLQVQAKQEEADAHKRGVEQDEAEAQVQTRRCMEQKAECESILAKAIPALEASVKALRTLKKNDIVEVKSMGRPPPAVKLTMECCCLLMTVRPKRVYLPNTVERIDDYWEPAKKHLLGDPKFLQKLLDFDKDNVDENIIRKVKPYLDMPEFQPSVVQKASVAAAGLCKWVHAIVAYDEVAKMVAPRREALAEANADLQDAVEALKTKQSELAAVLRRLQALKRDLEQVLATKEGLENEVESCRTKLQRASMLLDGLSGERSRWELQVKQLAAELNSALADSLVSSACVCYLGPFTRNLRDQMKSEWRSVLAGVFPVSDHCDVVSGFGEATEIQEWINNKLPNDSFSIENAVIHRWSSRWPIMIDPQCQASKWIRKVEEKSSLRVCKATHVDLARFAEVAMTEGSVLLVEDVSEEIDPVLSTLLSTPRIKQNTPGDLTRVREATMNLDEEFRLYVTTKLSNPHFSPEVCSQVLLLNFVATTEGLSDQLMNITVRKERPELEAQRDTLLKKEAHNKQLLQDLEDRILQLLSQAEGSLLDDDRLIQSLSESQHTAKQILDQVESAQRTKRKIHKSRMAYLSVVRRAANAFSCVTCLATVESVYDFSLQWYLELYQTALDQAEPCATVAARVDILKKHFSLLLYERVSHCLFEHDRLMFAFILAVKCAESEDRLEAASFRRFLFDECGKEEAIGMLEEARSGGEDAFALLLQVDSFWDSPAKELLDSLGTFERLLLAKHFRTDQLLRGIRDYICVELGEAFVHAPTITLEDIYRNSFASQPIMFLLSAGSTPVVELTRVAKKMDGSRKLIVVSMGQGQHDVAENAVNQAATSGHWVCLENCHVVVSWLPALATLCDDLSSRRLHPNFRLWLTCLPSPALPVSLLQDSYKVSLEAPRGLRANLLGTFGAMDKGWFAGGPDGKGFKALVYSLSFFHAVVQERCRFWSLGWNNPYQFSAHDLNISMDQLKLFLTDYAEAPFRMLVYLAGELNYGGRVTDDNDRRTIMCVLEQFYTPTVLNDDGFAAWSDYAPPHPPEEHTIKSYLNHIRELPRTDTPELFGLHANASIRQSTQLAKDIVSKVVLLQPREDHLSGKSWVDDLTEIMTEVQDSLPMKLDTKEVLRRFPLSYGQSLNTVLQQEVESYNQLIDVIESTLSALSQGVAGIIAMSPELEETANSLLHLEVPKRWKANSYPSLKGVHAWVKDLSDRLQFMAEWVANGTPTNFWIGAFFFVSAFLTAVRQDFARKNKLPIDIVCFRFNVLATQADQTIANTSVCIQGLFLEGAGWDADAKHLVESSPRELLVEFPVIELLVCEARERAAALDGEYACPVYKTLARSGTLSTTGHSTNFVLYITLSAGREYAVSHWVKRSVALFISAE